MLKSDQTNRQTDRQTNRQGKNNMFPTTVVGDIKTTRGLGTQPSLIELFYTDFATGDRTLSPDIFYDIIDWAMKHSRTDTQTDRQTDRQTDKPTNTDRLIVSFGRTDRRTHRQTETITISPRTKIRQG
ncbi:hypothetical protein DPMN_023249 [Dreissena polymorpha]|uniref:Uncharacterized protein n=1 Tax=Dreissena polymorpha TaxID=45954 RepID=A0A9D4LPA6_DREPO|nr:hypothetical protein DPMN_023249 [Dreissena polymorpha]